MALRKEPHRRYASVEQFAQDIRRHLEHLPVTARKDTLGFKGATEMYGKALELAQPEATSSHPSEQALYSTADSCAGLGEAEAILAAGAGPGRQKQIERWNQARSWYERSLKIWGQIKEPGMLSPDGFECIPPSVVARQLALSNEALRRLGANANSIVDSGPAGN